MGWREGERKVLNDNCYHVTPSILTNSIGLVLDIAGVILLYQYGLPEPLSRTGAKHLILEQSDAAEADKAKRYDCLARVGVSLLILGFGFQLISNFL